jgi:molecular chaperone GrpE
MSPLDDTEKLRLVGEFRAFLDQWENGAAEAELLDLRSLLAEMAALKNEVRLESRQFRSALEELKTHGEALRLQNERLTRDLDRVRGEAAHAQRQAERRLLLGIVDLRDRLQAGADAAAARRPSALARLVPGETRFARAVSEGLTLTLQRLDQLLETHRVRPIEVLGKPLDPQIMRALGVEAAPDAPEGVVLREVRRGFHLGGDLLRAAEVIVNKKAT